MAKNIVPIRPSETSASDDGLDKILRRLMIVLCQLDLARRDFGDLTGLPPEHQSAGLIVDEAYLELDRLYDELDRWHVTHVHTAKEVRP